MPNATAWPPTGARYANPSGCSGLFYELHRRNTPLEETGFYANYYVVDAPVLKALEVFGEPHRE